MTYTTNDLPTLTMTWAESYLGGRSWRPLTNNTELGAVTVRRPVGASWGGFTVRLHSTNILTITGPEDDPARFLFLDLAGWWSVTSFQRLNAMLPKSVWSYDAEGVYRPIGASVSIGSHRGVTSLYGRDSEGAEWSHPYHDGIVIDTHTGRPTFGSLHAATDDIFQTDRPTTNKGN